MVIFSNSKNTLVRATETRYITIANGNNSTQTEKKLHGHSTVCKIIIQKQITKQPTTASQSESHAIMPVKATSQKKAQNNPVSEGRLRPLYRKGHKITHSV